MRKPASVLFLLICALSALILSACQQQSHKKEEQSDICAFICDIDEDTVTIDIAEYITAQDEEKMKIL